MLHYFVCWYVKSVEKVPFRKSGHICYGGYMIPDSGYVLVKMLPRLTITISICYGGYMIPDSGYILIKMLPD